MKKPTNAEEMVAFLGVCGYYKKFIQGYDYILHPLRKYTIRNQNGKKNKNFNKKKRIEDYSMKSKVNIHGINPDKFVLEENKEASEAYLKILEILSSKPILKLFDPEKEIIVETDVSAYAWGAVL